MRKVDLCSVLLNLGEVRKLSAVLYRGGLKHLAGFLAEFLMEPLHSGVYCLAGLSGNTNCDVVLRFLFQKRQNLRLFAIALSYNGITFPMACLGSGIYNFWPLINTCSIHFLSFLRTFTMLFPFYCFGKFQDVEGQIAGPYFIVKGFGANHLIFRKELVLAGITDTGINRPLSRTHLRDDPLNK